MRHSRHFLATALLLASLAPAPSLAQAKAPPSGGARAATPRYQADASLQELMLAEVNPAATELWNSTASVTSATGTEETRPRSDADWLELRHRALVLLEAGNLLLVPGRPIVAPGGKVKDAEQPGIQGPAQIRHAIDTNPLAWSARVEGLRRAARTALKAIEKKDSDALSDAGGDIDAACEACHAGYWYPPARATGKAGR
jgi:hypothetical protein